MISVLIGLIVITCGLGTLFHAAREENYHLALAMLAVALFQFNTGLYLIITGVQ